MKKETIEEAAYQARRDYQNEVGKDGMNECIMLDAMKIQRGFELGAEWQAEQEQSAFVKKDDVDGEWLSPVATERVWQEEQLVNIFGHYPNASPRWQYMNGLIQNSLQAERMYSEEDLREAIRLAQFNDDGAIIPMTEEEIISQFKKK